MKFVILYLVYLHFTKGDDNKGKIEKFARDAFNDIKSSKWRPTAIGFSLGNPYSFNTPYGPPDVNIGEFSFSDCRLSEDEMEVLINFGSSGLTVKTNITLKCSHPDFKETRTLSVSTNAFGISLTVARGTAGRFRLGQHNVEFKNVSWKSFEISNGTVNNVTQYIMSEMVEPFSSFALETYSRNFLEYFQNNVLYSIAQLDSIFAPPSLLLVTDDKIEAYFAEVIQDMKSQRFTMDDMSDFSSNSGHKYSNFSLFVKNVNHTSEFDCVYQKFYCGAPLVFELDLEGAADWQIPDSPGMHNVTEHFKSRRADVKIEFGRDGKLYSGKVVPSFKDWYAYGVKVVGNQEAVQKFVKAGSFSNIRWMIMKNVEKSLAAFVISKFAAKQSMLK